MKDGKEAVRVAVHVDTDALGGAEHSLATLLRHLDPRFRVDLVVTDAAVGEFLAKSREIGQVIVCAQCARICTSAPSANSSRRSDDCGPTSSTSIATGSGRVRQGILGGLLSRGVAVVGVEHAEPLPTESRRLRLSRRLLAKRMAAIVTVGETTARLIESFIGLAPGSVRTIHNGVEVLPIGAEMRRRCAADRGSRPARRGEGIRGSAANPAADPGGGAVRDRRRRRTRSTGRARPRSRRRRPLAADRMA